MLWELRWLAVVGAAVVLAVAFGRGARPWLALAGAALLTTVAAPTWSAAWGLVASYAVWGLPAVALLGLVSGDRTAVGLGALSLALAGALTATAAGLHIAIAACAGGALAVVLLGPRFLPPAHWLRRAALALALVGPTTWRMFHVKCSTVPAEPLPASLLVAALAAVTVRHLAWPGAPPETNDPAPSPLAWVLAALIPLAAFVPSGVVSEPLADAVTPRIETDDRLGWRWWVRYAPSPEGASDSSADAGP